MTEKKQNLDQLKESFFKLTSDSVLNSVEAALQKSKGGARATGRMMALNSLENRVYEIEFEDNSSVVAKFYRPGRWTHQQISEEHEFLNRLSQVEVPVVSALALEASSFGKVVNSLKTLAENPDGIFFGVFPKVRGRLADELSDSQLQTLGRYLGRIHQVGKSWIPKYRKKLNVKDWAIEPLKTLMDSNLVDTNLKPHYKKVAEDLIRRIEPLLKSFPASTVHGDCHLGNTLWNHEAPFFLDFDDMMIAPPVQDLWMILRGRGEEVERQREVLLSSYESMCEFDRSSFALIEPLRALRIIHYSAWVVRRWDDPSFPRAFPHLTSTAYWRSEVEALQEISEMIL